MTKKAKIYNGEETISSLNGAEKLDCHMKKKKEIRTFSNTMQKNKLKWFKHLNLRPNSIKLLEENIGRTLLDINCNNTFLIPGGPVVNAGEVGSIPGWGTMISHAGGN